MKDLIIGRPSHCNLLPFRTSAVKETLLIFREDAVFYFPLKAYLRSHVVPRVKPKLTILIATCSYDSTSCPWMRKLTEENKAKSALSKFMGELEPSSNPCFG